MCMCICAQMYVSAGSTFCLYSPNTSSGPFFFLCVHPVSSICPLVVTVTWAEKVKTLPKHAIFARGQVDCPLPTHRTQKTLSGSFLALPFFLGLIASTKPYCVSGPLHCSRGVEGRKEGDTTAQGKGRQGKARNE